MMTISLFTLALVAALMAIIFMYVKIKHQKSEIKENNIIIGDYRSFSVNADNRLIFISKNLNSFQVIFRSLSGLMFVVKTFEYKEGDFADYEYALLEAEEFKSHLEYKI